MVTSAGELFRFAWLRAKCARIDTVVEVCSKYEKREERGVAKPVECSETTHGAKRVHGFQQSLSSNAS